jgi:hypothetical protein
LGRLEEQYENYKIDNEVLTSQKAEQISSLQAELTEARQQRVSAFDVHQLS